MGIKRTAFPFDLLADTAQSQRLMGNHKNAANRAIIHEQLSEAFDVNQSEVNEMYSSLGHKSPTINEREKRFPHLNAPLVELKDLLKKPDVSQVGEKTASNDRLKSQLAWLNVNRKVLDAVSRARGRVDTAINGARLRRREKADFQFKILQRIRARITAAVRGRNKHQSSLNLLGCSLEAFKAHLEKQFKDGMSWANYGDWHIDHIRPCATFDFNNPSALKECFHYTNLQPMWKLDNQRKNSKWEGRLVRRPNQQSPI